MGLKVAAGFSLGLLGSPDQICQAISGSTTSYSTRITKLQPTDTYLHTYVYL